MKFQQYIDQRERLGRVNSGESFMSRLGALHSLIIKKHTTGCIKKKVIVLQRAIIRELLGIFTIGFHIRKDQAFSY